jgi:hypothetical protein
MDQSIAEQIIDRLKDDYSFKKENAGWLQNGKCPSCDKHELFTNKTSPWVVRCGRENKCGTELYTKELYPEIFEGFNKRYKATEADPNATARAYLRQARGFDSTLIKGWYEQGKFWHPDADKGTATVRFYLDAEKTIYMERFVEEVTITDPDTGEKISRKAHFRGSHRGLWWQPPGLEIVDGDEVWIVEGILDAIALNLNGIKAVAILSCVNYPQTMLEKYRALDVTWVVALDNDKAGRKYTTNRKGTGHVDRLRAAKFTATAAQMPGNKKIDWNDAHNRGQLKEKDLANYRYYGRLLLAQSASEKALLMYQQTERKSFWLTFDNRMHWFSLNLERYEKAITNLKDGDTEKSEEEIREQALIESSTISEISNCAFKFLYFQANLVTDESWYYASIDFPHGAPSVKNTFTGGQLSSASEFKKRLLSVAAGSMFTGSSFQLERILQKQLFNIKTVQTIDFMGYAKEHQCYVFNKIAVKDGRVYRLNDEDFFDAGKLSIKSLNQSVNLNINIDREQYSTEWVEALCKCFGTKGVTALAFWLGSLFAEQIRQLHKSYPFIEIIGEPGAGKTTLIEFLWKLCGRRDYEGFDPSKSTLAARARNFSQVANLPVVLIEGDRDENGARASRFDWDELKTAYNGRSVRSRGMKNSGNETYEPPFRGTVVISQNDQVNASEAVLQRIIHLKFTKQNHSPESKALAEGLEKIPMEQVSHFILDALRHEKQILTLLRDKTPDYERQLLSNEKIRSVRIAKNHAQMMALTEALGLVIDLKDNIIARTQQAIVDLAIERQQAINADHPMVQEFWEAFDYLNSTNRLPTLNHSKNKELIAVNLNHFVTVATNRRQQIPLLGDLKKHLKSSKHRKYLGQKTVSSMIDIDDENRSKSVKCWVFENDAAQESHHHE